MNQASEEIAATAARIVVEEGMEYGPAKRRAARERREKQRRDRERFSECLHRCGARR